jgi:tetratricopeptide (TPR) repeat protein
MPRRGFGRRARLVLAVVCLGTGIVPAVSAQADKPAKYSRLQRLEQWTAALERHQPGEADGALNTFADWDAREFAELKVTFYSALQLVRDPTIRTFLRPSLSNGRGPMQVFYSGDELRQLIAVAARLKGLGENHMLRRGAMLHLDAVALGAGGDSRGGSGRSDFFIVKFDDGQGLGNEDAGGQIDFGRFLLEQVRPDPHDFRPKPSGDDWVRRWYRTLIAYMLAEQHFNVRDVDRALELFRDDPEVLFISGVLHETLAAETVQEPLRKSENLRDGVRVRSGKGELSVAEDLLRRAVKRSPAFPEARLHLGRVLAEQGQHKDALQELTQALPAIEDHTFQYYAQMFLGRSAAETGDTARAHTAFALAAQLVPAAQSPLIALSQLAYTRGDVAEAAMLLAGVATLPALENDDPWWFYSTTSGRFFRPSHADLVESLRMEMPR